MDVPHAIDSEHISQSIAIQAGFAAWLTTSSDQLKEVFEAYLAEKKCRQEAESKYQEEHRERLRLEKELMEWKKLAEKPRVVIKGKAKVKNVITGDVHEFYGKDNSIQGPQQLSRVGTGRQAHTLPQRFE